MISNLALVFIFTVPMAMCSFGQILFIQPQNPMYIYLRLVIDIWGHLIILSAFSCILTFTFGWIFSISSQYSTKPLDEEEKMGEVEAKLSEMDIELRDLDQQTKDLGQRVNEL